ncbi:MAG: helix-hairpin-helix domain-containing protein, partial [Pseudolabrys sp.]
FDVLEQLKKKMPGELGAMAALPGLGPKRIKLLYSKLHVRTIDDLRKAVQAGKLHKRKGFGPGIEKKLAAALAKPVSTKRYKINAAEQEASPRCWRTGRRAPPWFCARVSRWTCAPCRRKATAPR